MVQNYGIVKIDIPCITTRSTYKKPFQRFYTLVTVTDISLQCQNKVTGAKQYADSTRQIHAEMERDASTNTRMIEHPETEAEAPSQGETAIDTRTVVHTHAQRLQLTIHQQPKRAINKPPKRVMALYQEKTGTGIQMKKRAPTHNKKKSPPK